MPAWYGARRLLTLDDAALVAYWRASFGSLTGLLTLTRASNGTYFDSAGDYQVAATDAARFDYTVDGSATFRGLLAESAFTNGVRNSQLSGAVAGSPGTLPTNVTVSGFGTLTQTLSTGTEYNMPYVDFRYNGTTSTTAANIAFEATTQIAASTGQTWTGSFYHRLVAGDLTNVTTRNIQVNERNGAGSTLAGTAVAFTPTSTIGRASATRTFNQATTAFTSHLIVFGWSSGVAVDFTLRVYAPALGQKAFAASVPELSTTAQTRAADVLAAANYAGNPAIIQYRSVQTGTRARKVVNPWSGVSSETDLWIEAIAIYAVGTPAAYLNSKLTVDSPY
jgi:hypothetical protein